MKQLINDKEINTVYDPKKHPKKEVKKTIKKPKNKKK